MVEVVFALTSSTAEFALIQTTFPRPSSAKPLIFATVRQSLKIISMEYFTKYLVNQKQPSP